MFDSAKIFWKIANQKNTSNNIRNIILFFLASLSIVWKAVGAPVADHLLAAMSRRLLEALAPIEVLRDPHPYLDGNTNLYSAKNTPIFSKIQKWCLS